MVRSIQSITLSGTAPILFISDLHLSHHLPKTYAAFLEFIQKTAIHAQALFILGDLFEYWIGDDCLKQTHSLAAQIANHLAKLKQHGVKLYVLPGNRDFLLGRQFAHIAQAILLNDYCLLDCFQHAIVLAHGDTLCTNDTQYLRYRAWVHKPWIQRLFLSLPLDWRLKLSARLHAHSQASQKRNMAHQKNTSTNRYEVNNEAAQALLQQYHANILIHGHTHRPQCHTLPHGTRWVLSDWDLDHDQRANYLRLDMNGLHAISLI